LQGRPSDLFLPYYPPIGKDTRGRRRIGYTVRSLAWKRVGGWCYARDEMETAVWTAIGLLAVTSLGTLFYLGSRIDALAARMDVGFARVDTRFDSIEFRLRCPWQAGRPGRRKLTLGPQRRVQPRRFTARLGRRGHRSRVGSRYRRPARDRSAERHAVAHRRGVPPVPARRVVSVVVRARPGYASSG